MNIIVRAALNNLVNPPASKSIATKDGWFRPMSSVVRVAVAECQTTKSQQANGTLIGSQGGAGWFCFRLDHLTQWILRGKWHKALTRVEQSLTRT